MKKTALITIAVATALAISTANAANWNSGHKKPLLKTQMEKVSYSIGYDMGHSMKQQNINIKPRLLKLGMEDALRDHKPEITKTEMKSVMATFQKDMMQKAMKKHKELAAKNQADSNAYMTKIAQEPGIHIIEKGLYYKVLTVGAGAMPTKDDSVTVNYSGSLINGKVFDSSYKQGKPATFQVNEVIPGWTKALERMREGSIWIIYIASNLAYGKFAPPSIGPDQALTFKVDLISVKKQKKEHKPTVRTIKVN